jgi:plasmid stabilization system protein ParE
LALCLFEKLSRRTFEMPRGEKSKYTDKQERKAEHIAEGYEKRGTSKKEAKRRAWATVNKIHGGGERKGGGGYGKAENRAPNRKGGRKGGRARARSSSSSSRSTSKSHS